MAEAKKLLVIGNGFDLHHGMKTRYDDFITFVKLYLENKNSIFSTNNIPNEYMSCLKNIEINVNADFVLT